MYKKITFLNYVPSNEQAIITEAVNKMCCVGARHNIPPALLIKPLEVIYKDIEPYAFIQPLIDGRGGIAGHRLYLNSNYIYDGVYLDRIVAHEVLHTFSEKNILKHESLLFKSLSHDYEVRYNKKIDFLTTEDIQIIERGMKID